MNAKKKADTAPRRPIEWVKVPAAASTSSMFLTFRVHPALPPYPSLESGQVRVGAVQRSHLVYPSRPAAAAESRWNNLGRHNS